MIPWFVATLIDIVGRPFGWFVNVRATQGRWGCDRIYLARLRGEPIPLRPLAPYRAEAPIEATDSPYDAPARNNMSFGSLPPS